MKNLEKVFILVLMVLTMSCTPESQVPELKKLTDETSDTSLFAVSVSQFETDTANFAAKSRMIFDTALVNDPVPIKAFTIHAADLLEAMGLPPNVQCTDSLKYTYARIYLGLNSNNEFKLYMTPVVDAKLSQNIGGKDVIRNGPYEGNVAGVTTGEVSNGSYVMDFTSPCPKTCPEKD
ncbi:MAG: hypothetical protein RIC35_19250 [Marinoscillum sp.]